MPFTLNLYDCSSAIKGTGVRGCTTDMDRPRATWLLESGTTFNPATQTFNQALIDQLVQDEKLIILPSHVEFANNTSETVYEDYQTGESSFVRYSPVDFLLTYQKGVCFSNSLFGLKSKAWDVLFVDFDSDQVSRIWGEETTTGLFRGFETNLVNLDSVVISDGSVATKTALRIQLSQKGTSGYIARRSFLTSDANISFSDISGVNDLTLNANDLSSSGVKIQVAEGCGKSQIVTSLDNVNFWRVLDSSGNAVALTSVTFANNEYTLTSAGFSAASSYDFEVYDSVSSKEIAIVEGVYYKSDKINLTLV